MQNILIVDDDPDTRILLKEVLILENETCLECDNGEDALRIIEDVNEMVALVLLDIRLPGFNGLELIKKLRTHGISLPVIAISALDPVSFEIKCQNAGFDNYFSKPLNLTELIDVIKLHLQNYRNKALGNKIHNRNNKVY